MTAVSTVEVVAHEPPTSPLAIVVLLRLAIEKGIPVEALERLQALHERVSDRAAASEFAHAMANFQAKCPPITKTSRAEIATASGGKFTYAYAELDHIARTIAPFLRDLGLSYTWDSETKDKMLLCRCTLRHVNGHVVTASFSLPVESKAGMSEQQKHAAALSYARRQSLIQVLGLTTCDPDTDAADPTPISQDQADDVEALISEEQVDRARFLTWAKVAKLTEIRAHNLESCVNAIRATGREKRERAAARAQKKGGEA